MPLKRSGIELAVERALPPAADGAPRTARLTSTFSVDGASGPPTPVELGNAIAELDRELDEAIRAWGPGLAAGPASDRTVEELVETYRPRQIELVTALREEGAISADEADRLRRHLGTSPPGSAPSPTVSPIPAPPPPRAEEPPVTDRPLAALPLSNDRTPSVPRPVEQLLREYRIESLKQAGAVRARRQISYDEYMALKRHFAESEPGATPA